MTPRNALRLLAEDADDLEVISAALQDAVTRIGDIRWEKEARRLTIAFSRFRWEAAESKGERVLAGFQLGGVEGVRARNVRLEAKDAVLELLAVTFEPAVAPAGRVVFAFADGADIAVEVECVDAALADLSEPWRAPHKPGHET